MKKFFLSFALAAALLLGGFSTGIVTTSCSSTQQRVAFNTLYSVEQAVVSSYDGYLDTVVKGTTTTSSLPKVSKAFNDFQASMLVAETAVQFSTNALAPAALQQAATDVINLIITAKGH